MVIWTGNRLLKKGIGIQMWFTLAERFALVEYLNNDWWFNGDLLESFKTCDSMLIQWSFTVLQIRQTKTPL